MSEPTQRPDESPFPTLDRTALMLTSHADNSDDAYWQSRTPQERIEAVEMLRRLNYGLDATSSRLQRLLEVVERPRRHNNDTQVSR